MDVKLYLITLNLLQPLSLYHIENQERLSLNVKIVVELHNYLRSRFFLPTTRPCRITSLSNASMKNSGYSLVLYGLDKLLSNLALAVCEAKKSGIIYNWSTKISVIIGIDQVIIAFRTSFH